jgi:hypothetical protein
MYRNLAMLDRILAIEILKRHLSIALLIFNAAFWQCIASKKKTAAESACNRGQNTFKAHS